MSAQHTPGRQSSDVRSLFNCIEGLRHIESVGKRQCTEGRDTFGWSAKDSYEDAELWARYYAGQIIAKATGSAS